VLVAVVMSAPLTIVALVGTPSFVACAIFFVLQFAFWFVLTAVTGPRTTPGLPKPTKGQRR